MSVDASEYERHAEIIRLINRITKLEVALTELREKTIDGAAAIAKNMNYAPNSGAGIAAKDIAIDILKMKEKNDKQETQTIQRPNVRRKLRSSL